MSDNSESLTAEQFESIGKMMEQHAIEKEQRYMQYAVTPEFIWYEASLLSQKMESWTSDFKRVVQAMEERQKDYLKMLQDLLQENKELKKKLMEKSNVGS